MLNTDRADFETQLNVLFGGFPTFLTPPRIEAYWRGLSKMPLSVFVRCVDHALGEAGTEKLPTVNTLWQMSRSLRAQQRPVTATKPEPFDWYLGFANKALLRFLVLSENPADETTLHRLVALKNKLQEQCRKAGGEAEADEWRSLMMDAFAKEMPA